MSKPYKIKANTLKEKIKGSGPGLELYEFLKEHFDLTIQHPKNYNIQKALTHKLNNESLSDYLHEIIISFLLRNLVEDAKIALCDKKNILKDVATIAENKNIITKKLKENYDLDSDLTIRLSSILLRCVDASRKEINKRTRNEVMLLSLNNEGYGCYICGYKSSDSSEFNIEHSWPHSLGGSSEEKNLIVCCKPCNESKEDYIKHFEVDRRKTIFKKTSDVVHSIKKISVFASLKNSCACTNCGDLFLFSGPSYVDVEEGRTYTFQNVSIHCNKCR